MTDHMTPAEARDSLDRDLDWKSELTAGRRALETIAADTIQYGIHIKFPDQQFMHPILGRRGVWTTDKALAEHELSGLRENAHFRDSNIRLVARRVSHTWEVTE